MKEKERLAWFAEEHLIHDSNLSEAVKHLLLVIHTSLNHKSQKCWLSQPKLARKTGASRRKVQRAFHAAQEAGVIISQLVRKGKGRFNQYNEYWINWEKLHELGQHQDDASSITDGVVTGWPSEGASVKNEISRRHFRNELASKSTGSWRHGDAQGLQGLGVKGEEAREEASISPSAHTSNPGNPKSTTPPVSLSEPPKVPPVPPSGTRWHPWKPIREESVPKCEAYAKKYGSDHFSYVGIDGLWTEINYDEISELWKGRNSVEEANVHAA